MAGVTGGRFWECGPSPFLDLNFVYVQVYTRLSPQLITPNQPRLKPSRAFLLTFTVSVMPPHPQHAL